MAAPLQFRDVPVTPVSGSGPLEWGTYLLFALVLVSCAVFRLPSLGYTYYNEDEVIAVKVAEHVVTKGSLDTNWENAAVPDLFKYPQYNFSAYLLTGAGILKLVRSTRLSEALSTQEILRWWSSLLGLIAVALMFLVGKRLFGPLVGLGALALGSLNPLLYQDSLYARPETFLTVLALLYIYTLESSTKQSSKRLFLASLLLGAMVATKVSALALLPLLFLPLEKVGPACQSLGSFRQCLREYGREVIACTSRTLKVAPFGLALGFGAGAPYALVNFDMFMFGIRRLHIQYTSDFWPHGLADGSFLDRIVYAANYFFPTTGWLLFLLSLFGAFFTARHRRFTTFAIFAVCLLFAIRFSSYPVFFERNFSHVLPFFLIFAAYGVVYLVSKVPLKPAAKAFALVSLFILSAASEARTTYTLRFRVLPGFEAANLSRIRDKLQFELGVAAVDVGWVREYSQIEGRLGNKCRPTLLEFPYAGDRDSIGVVRRLEEQDGFVEVGRFTSPFAGVSPSTLQMYLTPSAFFLFRETDFGACKDADIAFVSKRAVGDTLAIRSIKALPAWTRSGAYNGVAGPFGSQDYYGSWSGSDGRVGRLRVVVSVKGQKFVVLPYMTGPVANRQSLQVRDAASGQTIWRSASIEASRIWVFRVVPIPSTTAEAIVEAVDAGSDWGEWLAVEWPRTLKKE